MSNTLNIYYTDCDGNSQTESFSYNGSPGETTSFCFDRFLYNNITLDVDGTPYPLSLLEQYITIRECDGSTIPSGSCSQYEVSLVGGTSAIFTYTPCGSPLSLSVNLTNENTPMIICADAIVEPVPVNVNYIYNGTCDPGNISGKQPVSRCGIYEIYIKNISLPLTDISREITYDDCDGTTLSTILDYTSGRTHYIQATEDTLIFNSSIYEVRSFMAI